MTGSPRRRSRRSPTPSAIRPAAASTCSPASTTDGVTAAQVAEQFGLHPNVARHHLDKLAAGGYLEVAVERAEGAAPAARRSTTAPPPTASPLEVPVRSDDLVLALLGRSLALLPPTRPRRWPRRSARVRRGDGRRARSAHDATQRLAAGQRSLRSAMHAVADALTAHGFAAHTDQRNDQLRIVNNTARSATSPSSTR